MQSEGTLLPGLYRAADEASLRGQNHYVLLSKLNLWLLIAGALCSLELLHWTQAWRVAAATCLVGSAFLTRFTISGDYRERWYSGRAVAESIKSLVWKFAVGAGHTPISMSESDAQAILEGAARELRDAAEATGVVIRVPTDSKAVVTDAMRAIRASALEQRWQVYYTQRLDDQVGWYSRKAGANEAAAARWSWAVFGLELVAAVAAVCLAFAPQTRVNPVGLFSTVAAAALAWMEFRRFEELHQAYSTTTYDLKLVLDQDSPTTDDELGRYVDNAEGAISREHVMWIARRHARIRVAPSSSRR